MKRSISGFLLAALFWMCAGAAARAETILFVGNSFTYGAYSPVERYRPETVTDLNGTAIGGVPALFKTFTTQAGLHYDVSLETMGSSGLDFHYREKAPLILRAWDHVILQSLSMLDKDRPGDPTALIAYSALLGERLRTENPKVQIRLVATWSRADQVYRVQGRWHGRPIGVMAEDIHAAYDLAARNAPGIGAVLPVGRAWTRAMEAGLADANPYDGIAPGQINLWAPDHYHGSSHGYYLEALVIFGSVTGVDPRTLGARETAAAELGIASDVAVRLQEIAFATLAPAAPR